jgi:hypothetical protein
VQLHVLVDWSLIEVYAVQGQRVITDQVFPDSSQDLKVFAAGGSARLKAMDVWTLRSIWTGESDAGRCALRAEEANEIPGGAPDRGPSGGQEALPLHGHRHVERGRPSRRDRSDIGTAARIARPRRVVVTRKWPHARGTVSLDRMLQGKHLRAGTYVLTVASLDDTGRATSERHVKFWVVTPRRSR